tara:strand:+ start:252 stop:395 length:144 start_codon:yes stop_codon:yes gene_type:complete
MEMLKRPNLKRPNPKRKKKKRKMKSPKKRKDHLLKVMMNYLTPWYKL